MHYIYIYIYIYYRKAHGTLRERWPAVLGPLVDEASYYYYYYYYDYITLCYIILYHMLVLHDYLYAIELFSDITLYDIT